jgi:hypothetical protein
MRGLDPRIHAIAIAARACREDVDGRIKPGQDDFELHQTRCILGSTSLDHYFTSLAGE